MLTDEQRKNYLAYVFQLAEDREISSYYANRLIIRALRKTNSINPSASDEENQVLISESFRTDAPTIDKINALVEAELANEYTYSEFYEYFIIPDLDELKLENVSGASLEDVIFPMLLKHWRDFVGLEALETPAEALEVLTQMYIQNSEDFIEIIRDMMRIIRGVLEEGSAANSVKTVGSYWDHMNQRLPKY